MSRELLKETLRVMPLGKAGTVKDLVELLTAIEAELAKPEQEPAWYSVDNNGEGGAVIFYPALDQAANSSSVLDYGEEIIPLYTHPPRQQEPVLLSDKEITDIRHSLSNFPGYKFCREIEQAVLKANGLGGDK